MTATLSIKVPSETKTRLEAVARARKTKPSALLRQSLDQVLSDEKPPLSLYELNRDIFENLGHGGPEDLSANPKHMEGFGL